MKAFFIVAVSTLFIGLILNYSLDDPSFQNASDEIEYDVKTGNLDKAEKLFIKELAANKCDPDLNYGYVINHFNIPERTRIGKRRFKYRDDTEIYNYYSQLKNSADTSVEKDLGLYFSGLCYLCEEDYASANSNFKYIKNRKLKYLNNSLGNTYKKIYYPLAISYYEQEIKLKGNVEGAVQNLTDILIKTRNVHRFELLLKDESTNKYISLTKQREFYYLKGDINSYIGVLWLKFINSIDKYGFLGAFIIALIWLFYLRFIDVFEREKWYHISIVFIISIVFSYASFLLYDIFNMSLNFDLTGNWLNDLAYCIFGIGLIEETIKLIPFILFLVFTRAVNEPIDYIIYACVSALGFSFIENIIYFQNDSYQIMHGRALASVVSHMCNSSIIAYGFVVTKYKSKFPLFVSVLISLLLASLFHGLYDFWLVNETIKDFQICTMLILISNLFIWNTIKNNALNNSPFFRTAKKLESAKIMKYLFIALSLVFIFEYITISICYGPTTGNRLLLKSVLSGSFLMLLITGGLDQFKLKAGEWNRIKIWGYNEDL